ncbi:hypothetical protein Tco_1337886 [Tanacetum coccineum]
MSSLRKMFNYDSKGLSSTASNPSEPKINGFPNSTSSLGPPKRGLSKYCFMFLGTVRFGNDHVAAILGDRDLQWGNVLITRVYFVEGLGHNLFSETFNKPVTPSISMKWPLAIPNLPHGSSNIYQVKIEILGTGGKVMAFEQSSSKPGLKSMTSGQISFRNSDLTYAPSTITTQKPTEGDLDLLFEAMYDDYIGGQPSSAPADTAPTPTNSSSQATNCPNYLPGCDSS